MKLFFVAGLGYGDEGKGSIVDYLAKRYNAKLVVRYNGGAQAAHNVSYKDQWKEWSHTYAQFGSGTHLGAKTYLSKYMIVEPTALFREAHHLLETCGVQNPFSLLHVDEDALLITPYHRAVNRLKEISRGAGRHGSCGMGIGQVREESLTLGRDEVLCVKDVKNPSVLDRKLSALRERKIQEIRSMSLKPSDQATAAINMLTHPVSKAIEGLMAFGERVQIVDAGFLHEELKSATRPIIFEGAQGVLLDETYGFQPHTTWTNITFDNAYSLIKNAQMDRNDFDIVRVGVARSYMTRHGAGPLVTAAELAEVAKNTAEHNAKGEWQGDFRLGHLDLVALKYSVDVLRELDQIALTHMDVLQFLQQVCVRYKYKTYDQQKKHWITEDGYLQKPSMPTFDDQCSLRYTLDEQTTPMYWPMTQNLPELVSDILKVPVKILSYGPTAGDKKEA